MIPVKIARILLMVALVIGIFNLTMHTSLEVHHHDDDLNCTVCSYSVALAEFLPITRLMFHRCHIGSAFSYWQTPTIIQYAHLNIARAPPSKLFFKS